MSKKITATHERVDDIPTIIAHLKNMGVAEFLDTHFPTNGNWQGLSLGWTTVVWLTFILSEGDHRLYRVEPWGKAHRCTLSRCLGNKVKPRDLTDDRLATILDSLGVAARWVELERELNQSVLRVYDLQGRVVRVDTTTAAAYVTPEGRFQLGHSKDHRPDRPQGKIAMSVLDPLGLPLTTTVVGGHTADDPRYLPEIAKVRQIAGSPGLTSVGDCKMAAIGTRAEIVAHRDYSLCPLSAKPMPEAALDRLLAPVLSGALASREIRLPNADGTRDETDRRSGGDRLCIHGRAQRVGASRTAPNVAGAPAGRALAGLGHEPGEELTTTRRPCQDRDERAGGTQARQAALTGRSGGAPSRCSDQSQTSR
jgi:hypothetical protein